jgi:PLP dependent protein
MGVFEMTEMRESLMAIRERIAAACTRVGKSPEDVRLIAVTKNVDPDRIREAVSLGVEDFGENYIQEAREKIGTIPGRIRWHMIGHIQTNKLKYIPQLFTSVHSVDRVEVLDKLERYGKEMDVLFEVNLSGETSKNGAAPDAVRAILEKAGALRALRPVGLMTMAPYTEDPEESRTIFAQLRSLRDDLNREFSMGMKELSMGMSSDFEVAIEEGSTMVRIGTAIFGERVYA